MKIAQKPSPNFNNRAPDTTIQYIILHYTGMPTAAEALTRMTTPSSEVSAHYLVDEDGTLIQMVEESKRAWHAGKSCWKENRDMNSSSIGIEIVNPGHEFGYRLFPEIQINAVKELVHDIMLRHSLPPSCLLAHSDIAPTRKTDPGELFPWQDFAHDGMGLWPALQEQDKAEGQKDEAAILLRKIGYDAPDSEVELEAALTAFQRHYRPTEIDGRVDVETLALLRALARIT